MTHTRTNALALVLSQTGGGTVTDAAVAAQVTSGTATQAALKAAYAATAGRSGAPDVQLGAAVRTVQPGTYSVLAFQNNDPTAPDSATRLYVLPRSGQSVSSGAGGDLKLFADDYAADQTNYRDMGWYFHANQVGPSYAGGDTGTRGGGVFWQNSKVNGTWAGKSPDIGWSMQDGQYVAGRVALATVNGTTPNIQFVFGTKQPRLGTKVAVVAEFQGDIGMNLDGDTAIRWSRTDAATVDNALTLQRSAGGGQVKLTLGSTQRLLLNGSGGLVLGNGSTAMTTATTDGFLYVNSMAGTPTGTPATYGAAVPMLIDTTGAKLWAYIGGAWKGVTLT